MIADQDGNLVWFHPLPAGRVATNFQVAELPAASPCSRGGRGGSSRSASARAKTSSTTPPTSRSAASGRATATTPICTRSDYHARRDGLGRRLRPDPHEPLLATAAAPTASSPTRVVQQIDIKTGLVMWEWHALGHIPITESHNPQPKGRLPVGLRPHQLRSAPARSGDVLLSARNTWTLYDVDIHSGAIRWRLGGIALELQAGPRRRSFYWQHDAEWQPGGLISLFDNGSDAAEGEAVARPAARTRTLGSHTVTLRKALTNPTRTLLAVEPGQHAQPARRQLADGLRRACRTSPSTTRSGPRAARRHARQERAGLQDLPRALERAPAELAVGRRRRSGIRALSVAVELERRDRRRELAGARRAPRRGARAGRRRRREPASRRRSRRRATGPYVQVQALDASGNVIGTSATVKA